MPTAFRRILESPQWASGEYKTIDLRSATQEFPHESDYSSRNAYRKSSLSVWQ